MKILLLKEKILKEADTLKAKRINKVKNYKESIENILNFLKMKIKVFCMKVNL